MNKKCSFEMTLFDDESVRKKLEVMDQWDAMIDDERNECEGVDEFVETIPLGSVVKVTLEIVQ